MTLNWERTLHRCTHKADALFCVCRSALRPASGHVVARGGGVHHAVWVPALPRRELSSAGRDEFDCGYLSYGGGVTLMLYNNDICVHDIDV